MALPILEAIKKTPVEVRTAFSGNTFNVVIQEPGSPVSYSYSHTITMHLLRSMNRLLIEAYGGSKARGLSESQVGALISDIFPFMIEMEVFDPSLQESISKRLFEASVFLYSSDGDNGLTMSEALEFESLILSTLSNASRAHYLLSQSCNEKMENISNVAPINANCYRKNFIRNAANIWNYLPGFGKYFNRLGPDESYEIYDLMQSFLRKGKSANADRKSTRLNSSHT